MVVNGQSEMSKCDPSRPAGHTWWSTRNQDDPDDPKSQSIDRSGTNH